ncbi:transposase [Micromonospora carbonacea]|uniref:transposase n=1 Tax=Micromonospora carbonacea TaxID=47853 RepID=UPI00371B676E
MPKPYPREFRDDVVRVARDRDPGVTVEQIAKDFGVHPMTLFKWMRQAEVDAGTRPGVSGSESAELREARKRIKLLEQENEARRWTATSVSNSAIRRRAATNSTWSPDVIPGSCPVSINSCRRQV